MKKVIAAQVFVKAQKIKQKINFLLMIFFISTNFRLIQISFANALSALSNCFNFGRKKTAAGAKLRLNNFYEILRKISKATKG